jgi:hypothetical protein
MENENELQQQGTPVVGLGEWMLTYLLAAIPLVGVVMLLIWAFGGNTNPNKANWAKASLIWAVIMMVIYFVFMAMFGAALLAGMGGMR